MKKNNNVKTGNAKNAVKIVKNSVKANSPLVVMKNADGTNIGGVYQLKNRKGLFQIQRHDGNNPNRKTTSTRFHVYKWNGKEFVHLELIKNLHNVLAKYNV